MNGETKKKWEDVGVTFRFVTPVLLLVIGTLGMSGIKGITSKIDTLGTHFTNHLSHHTLLEVDYERRITTIEVTQKIGN